MPWSSCLGSPSQKRRDGFRIGSKTCYKNMFKNMTFTKLRGSALETGFNYFGEQEGVSQAVLPIYFSPIPLSRFVLWDMLYTRSHTHTLYSICKDRFFPLFHFSIILQTYGTAFPQMWYHHHHYPCCHGPTTIPPN